MNTHTPHGFKTTRRRYGLTRQEAGEICGVSHRTVENWERGVNKTIPIPAQLLLKAWCQSNAHLKGVDKAHGGRWRDGQGG